MYQNKTPIIELQFRMPLYKESTFTFLLYSVFSRRGAGASWLILFSCFSSCVGPLNYDVITATCGRSYAFVLFSNLFLIYSLTQRQYILVLSLMPVKLGVFINLVVDLFKDRPDFISYVLKCLIYSEPC